MAGNKHNQGGSSHANAGYRRASMQRAGGGVGWFDGIIKQFYDAKDGLKPGGFLGALAGGMLGMSFIGTGSWIGILAMGVMTLAGAWGGNKAADAIASAMQKHSAPEKPDTPSGDRVAEGRNEPYRGTINGVPTAQALAEVHRTAARNAGIAGGEKSEDIQRPNVNALASAANPAQRKPVTSTKL